VFFFIDTVMQCVRERVWCNVIVVVCSFLLRFFVSDFLSVPQTRGMKS
jgi:hypothetical protein